MARRDLAKEFSAFEVIVEGESMAMQCDKLQLPEIERMMQTLRPGGAVGGLKTQHGLVDDFDVVVGLKGYSSQLEAFGAKPGIDGTSLIARASWVDTKTSEAQIIEVNMRGRVIKRNVFGEFKQGDNTEGEFTLALTFYEEKTGGREACYIDLQNGHFRLNGVDQAPGHTALFG